MNPSNQGRDTPAAMPRRRWLCAVVLAALTRPARAQPATAPLVAVLVSTGLHALDYLRQGLRDLGFVEGQDVVFAFRATYPVWRATWPA
jgi:hypothetical protein